MMPTCPLPVELLRDGRGIYGIGVSDLFDDQALAWSCGIDPRSWEHKYPGALILRPDRLHGTKPYRAVLQKITGGFRRSIFHNSIEERLRQFIHHEALRRAGLCWPPQPERGDPEWWSADKKQQARNRGVYHGKRLLSLHVINHLIGKALEEAADADAIKAARRFAFNHRENIYRASAQSRRVLQLSDTFPVLALLIYSAEHWRLTPRINFSDFNSWESEKTNIAVRKKAAANLVERGARLRDVAAALDIPMALRCIKPGVAHLVSDAVCQHPDLLHYMPEALPRSRIWLRMVYWAHREVGADYAEWVARNVPQIPGRLEPVYFFLNDLGDWVRAGLKTEAAGRNQQEARGRQFVTRPFTPSMSLKTVTKLSAAWHEAVATHMDGPEFAFPAPWYPSSKLGHYEILPIDNSADLYREGAVMHHCVGTYADEVKCGGLYVYSVRRDGKCLATLALARKGRGSSLIQIAVHAIPNHQKKLAWPYGAGCAHKHRCRRPIREFSMRLKRTRGSSARLCRRQRHDRKLRKH